VTLGAACVIDIVTAIVCNFGQLLMARYGRKHVDDTLDVFALHGVGGMTGCILASLFATVQINPYGGDGAFYGDPSRLGKAVLAVAALAVFFVVATLVCLYATNTLVELRCTGGTGWG
jgi:Amt family ammonium transporter